VLFIQDVHGKYGRRNLCKICHNEAYHPPKVLESTRTCVECGKVVVGFLNIEKAFRRTSPSGEQVIGHLAQCCKDCEESLKGLVRVGDKYLPKGIKEASKKGLQLTL
jgi:hypothetical protein